APPAGMVAGLVRRVDDGPPLPQAKLSLRLESRSPGSGRFVEVRRAETDALGEFRMDKLAAGRYELVASCEMLATHRIRFDQGETEGAGPFDIQLRPGGALRVRVVGAWQTPLPGQKIRIEAHGIDGSRAVQLTGLTDADGELLVQSLLPGVYWIQKPEIREEEVEAPGGKGSYIRRTEHGPTRTVTVAEGKTAEVLFELSCGITGTVHGHDGEPVARAIVRLTPAEFGKEGYRAVQTYTDGEGGYEIHGFPAGEYEVSVQVLGGQGYVVRLARLEFQEGDVRQEALRIPRTSLSGRITAADTGAPFDHGQEGVNRPQAQARLVKVEEGKVVRWLRTNLMAFADNDGRYRFVGLAPGHYRIWIPSPSISHRDASRVVLFTGGDLRGVDFALEPRQVGTLRLTVLEPDGGPAASVYFSLRTGETTTRSLSGKQSGDGTWDLPLEAGPREVHVYRQGFEVEVVEVPVTEGETIERTVKLRARQQKDG
ncbi:MAG: carboxypeptidase regulatory-like domain-containing protein, partial [Planctomycetota bacterium]